MLFYIEKLKISNFLSFFGVYEVTLHPFSGIICNYHEGKEDLIRCFKFVFGVELNELNIMNPLDLVHKALREEFTINNKIQCFVEFIINIVHENRKIQFSRGIKNGSSVRVEHKISDNITSKTVYQEKLNCFNLLIQKKNLIFAKDYFNMAIWGSSEDLELMVDICLRENYMLEEWKKARDEVEFLAKLKRRTAEKKYFSLKKSHDVLVKYTDKYRTIAEVLENDRTNSLINSKENSFEDCFLSSQEELFCFELQSKKNLEELYELEIKAEYLVQELYEYKLKEAVLQSNLYYKEIKLASKPVNASILQNRIGEMRAKLRETENQLPLISKKMQEIDFELKSLTQEICFALVSLNDIHSSNYLQNRFTLYGRLVDYLQPSRYFQLLKEILGSDIFYANLCDSLEDAINAINTMKIFRHGRREVFIIFENFSHKLKDLLIASGEKGIPTNTLEQLLIFLCRLKHYGVINEVPILIQRDFNYEEPMPDLNLYFVYIQNGFHFTDDGLICYKINEGIFSTQTQNEMKTNIIQMETEQELKFQELNDLLFFKYEALTLMNSLENDISFLKCNLKKTGIISHPYQLTETLPIPDIYNDYSEVFTQILREQELQEYETESPKNKDIPSRLTEYLQYSSTPGDDSVDIILKELEEVTLKKMNTQNLLKVLTQDLISGYTISFHFQNFMFQSHFLKFNNSSEKSKIFFEQELKKLKTLILQDDLEEFMGVKEWHKNLIMFLIKEFDTVKRKLKLATEKLRIVATERKKKLYSFLEHCSRHLTSTFHHFIDKALPFIDISFGPEEERLQLISSLGEDKINIVDIKHFNTFIKFISVLSLFLEIAVFENTPLMILDDIEEYFPSIKHDQSIKDLLDEKILEKILPESENASFHLLMRTGQYLEYYMKKNTPKNYIRNNGSDKGHIAGPMQIIYFAKNDFIQASEHYIWIHNQVLPDEYITEDCDCYSELHEIKFKYDI